MDFSFYKNKRVLITGHTGFKGTWLCELLNILGATVIGYSLEAPTQPALFDLIKMEKEVHSIRGDIRNRESLLNVFMKEKPELVIHMAAQTLVREGYQNPYDTYETNMMGTVNVLECIRRTNSVKSFLNVTTDKVYENKEEKKAYREEDRLDGYDPYSNSKSCSELITHCYQQSFLAEAGVAISTCRAGNVIGGGDFSKDRIIPDCVRAARKKHDILVRNPNSVRPYQHVLEPLFVYIMIAMEQDRDSGCAGSYNVGSDAGNCVTTGELVQIFCEVWKEEQGWTCQAENGPHEANYLQLDSNKLNSKFGWKSQWNIRQAVEKVVEWEKSFPKEEEMRNVMQLQIKEYLALQK